MRISNTTTTINGNIDGGISINGSNGFHNPLALWWWDFYKWFKWILSSFSSVDAVNLTNTYINFKVAVTNDDWFLFKTNRRCRICRCI